MTIRTHRRVIATGLAAFSLVAGLSPAAQAAPSTTASAQARACLGTKASGVVACFESKGDYFSVRDTKNDGVIPSAQWITDYKRKGECTFNRRQNPTRCNYDLAENHKIKFRVVMWDDRTGEVLTKGVIHGSGK